MSAKWGPQGDTPKNPAILVRLDADDYVAVAALAARSSQSLGRYVRSLVTRQLDREAA